MPTLEEIEEEIDRYIRLYNQTKHGSILSYSQKCSTVSEVISFVRKIFEQQERRFAFNLSLGYILHENGDPQSLRLFYASSNTALFPEPLIVTGIAEYSRTINLVRDYDFKTLFSTTKSNESIYRLAYTTADLYFGRNIPLKTPPSSSSSNSLPSYIVKSKFVWTGRAQQQNNLCVFYCLAQALLRRSDYVFGKTPVEIVSNLFEAFTKDHPEITKKNFPGVRLTDFQKLEKTTQLPISVYKSKRRWNGEIMVDPIYFSRLKKDPKQPIHLLRVQEHACLILDLERFAQFSACPRCLLAIVPRHLPRHLRSSCRGHAQPTPPEIKWSPGKLYRPGITLFEELSRVLNRRITPPAH